MQLGINALIAGSLASLLAGGLALVYGVLGAFNMALGQTVLLSGYTTWWLYTQMGAPLAVAMLIGVCVGMLLSWITYELCIGPFFRRHVFLPIVTTIALSMMLDALLLTLFEERPRTILSGAKQMHEVLGARISLEQGLLILLTLTVLVGFAVLFHSTRIGRMLRAVVQHESAARSLGISSSVLQRVVMLCSGFFLGIAGIFVGIDQSLTPTLAFPMTIKAYAAIIAGGQGNIWGAIAAAYLIALIEQLAVGVTWFGHWTIPAGFQSAVALFVMILVLLLKPAGIFASSSRSA